jgi:hypothetical protein
MACAPLMEHARIHASAVVAHPEAKLARSIRNLDFDPTRLCMPERIAQSFPSNPVDFIS